MKFWFSCLWFFCLFGSATSLEHPTEIPSHSLIYVHIGRNLPTYLTTAIAQARLFNPDCPIYLLANQIALQQFNPEIDHVTLVHLESIPLSLPHQIYTQKTQNSGFWRVTLERFLYLDDFIQQHQLKNVFHTENDVMIYFDLSEKIEAFQKCYSNMITTTFDCDERAVPGFVYISNPERSNSFAIFVAAHAELGLTDMDLFGRFKDRFYKTEADHLPILIPSYGLDRPLTNICDRTAQDPKRYSENLDSLNLIFDAAALGQFFGGIDPILSKRGSGFIAELSVFIPIYFNFEWRKDTKNRWIPYISYGKDEYPIANLHIHAKSLAEFYSGNQTPPNIPTNYWSSMPLDRVLREHQNWKNSQLLDYTQRD